MTSCASREQTFVSKNYGNSCNVVCKGETIFKHESGWPIDFPYHKTKRFSKNEFYVAHFNKHKSFSQFDQIYFVINPSTENVLFPIEGMSAFIDFKQDIQKCFDQKDYFFKQIMNIYKQEINEKLIDINTTIKPHPSDLTGKSTYEQTDIKFPNGYIRIACYDMPAHSGTNDALILDFFTEDVDRWLNNEVGKS